MDKPIWVKSLRSTYMSKSKVRKHKSQDAVVQNTRPINRFIPWLVISVVVIFIAVLRIRLLGIPLERDEGEYAYVGQLMLHGIPPFSLACNMKFPGIYAAYALIMAIFGQSIFGIHIGLLLVNSASIILLFILGRRPFGDIVGLSAGITYGILSCNPSVLGMQAHATQFLVVAALGGLIYTVKAVETRKLLHAFFGGLLMAASVLMKQHAVFLAAFAFFYLIWGLKRKQSLSGKDLIRPAVLSVIGFMVPMAILVISLLATGSFGKFWFWTFTYASKYVSQVPLEYAPISFWISFTRVLDGTWYLWILAGAGLVALFWDKQLRGKRVFIVGFLISAFLAVCPGFFFRSHYFITWLPAISLLAGIGLKGIFNVFNRFINPKAAGTIAAALFVLVAVTTIYAQGDYYFRMTPVEACRATYFSNPFPESLEIAGYIKNHTTKDDYIAILGSEPQICFYSDRRSAASALYMYPLVESHPLAHQMQLTTIEEIEAKKPKYIVYVNVSASWMTHPNADRTIIDWFDQYSNQFYQPVGLASIFNDGRPTEYLWAEEARICAPGSNFFIVVLQRKGS